MNKKDSVNLALVTSLKREVGLDDPDIEINVEGGVVLWWDFFLFHFH